MSLKNLQVYNFRNFLKLRHKKSYLKIVIKLRKFICLVLAKYCHIPPWTWHSRKKESCKIPEWWLEKLNKVAYEKRAKLFCFKNTLYDIGFNLYSRLGCSTDLVFFWFVLFCNTFRAKTLLNCFKTDVSQYNFTKRQNLPLH